MAQRCYLLMQLLIAHVRFRLEAPDLMIFIGNMKSCFDGYIEWFIAISHFGTISAKKKKWKGEKEGQ